MELSEGALKGSFFCAKNTHYIMTNNYFIKEDKNMKKIIIGVVIGAVSLFGLFKIGEYVHRKTVAGTLVKEENTEDTDFETEPDTDFLDEDIESEE